MTEITNARCSGSRYPDSVYYAWEDDVLAEPLTVENGAIKVPDCPRLGIEADPAKLETYRIL